MPENVSDDLQRTLRGLSELAASSPLPEAIQQVVNSAAELFTVAGSGVMFADDAHVLHYLAASDGHGRELEHVQERCGTGPCVEALIDDTIIKTPDVTADERWPQVHADLRETRVRAVVGVPIHVDGVVVGAMGAYQDHPHEWAEHEVDGLVAYSGLIERLLLTAVR